MIVYIFSHYDWMHLIFWSLKNFSLWLKKN